jgi:hypothetical protein
MLPIAELARILSSGHMSASERTGRPVLSEARDERGDAAKDDDRNVENESSRDGGDANCAEHNSTDVVHALKLLGCRVFLVICVTLCQDCDP